MSGSFDVLGSILEISKEICNHLRIVVITDGILDDQRETKERGELLYQTYKDMFKINSQCIRLNTGSTPETEGIMSILKLNNVKLCHLVEHNSNDMDNLAKVIIKLFLDDGLVGTPLKIGGENVKLKNNPWEILFYQPFGYTLENVKKKAKKISYFNCTFPHNII